MNEESERRVFVVPSEKRPSTKDDDEEKEEDEEIAGSREADPKPRNRAKEGGHPNAEPRPAGLSGQRCTLIRNP